MFDRLRKARPPQNGRPKFNQLQREALLSSTDDAISKLEHLEGELLGVVSGHMPPLSSRTGHVIDGLRDLRRRIERLEA